MLKAIKVQEDEFHYFKIVDENNQLVGEYGTEANTPADCKTQEQANRYAQWELVQS